MTCHSNWLLTARLIGVWCFTPCLLQSRQLMSQQKSTGSGDYDSDVRHVPCRQGPNRPRAQETERHPYHLPGKVFSWCDDCAYSQGKCSYIGLSLLENTIAVRMQKWVLDWAVITNFVRLSVPISGKHCSICMPAAWYLWHMHLTQVLVWQLCNSGGQRHLIVMHMAICGNASWQFTHCTALMACDVCMQLISL